MTPVKKRLVREKAIFILLPILLFGLLLRGLNSTFGSPSLYILNDEAIAHLSAFNMLGVVFPILGLIILPLAASFSDPKITWQIILLIYKLHSAGGVCSNPFFSDLIFFNEDFRTC